MNDAAVEQLFTQHGPTLTYAQAHGLGAHAEDLYRMRDLDKLHELSRGVYRLGSA
ncbi:MAG: type IV toxin-antitoxin system AbiEi family antitoxin domain-containing protein, partial [Thermoleophilia bacterium]|nr:type IV toxin-antitoxin system AbiEi family antitoxin domain-containing protein [Thermoleophilia bacterium]